MLLTRKGIICRSVKYGESSLIIDIFSGDIGMRSYIISGVRSKRAQTKSAILQVMNLVEFVAYDTKDPKKGLSRIKEIKLDVIYSHLSFEVIKSSIGLFLLEVSRKSIRISSQYEQLYDFIRRKFIELDLCQQGLGYFHLYFLIELAAELGFQMENNLDLQRPYFNLSEGIFTSQIGDHRYSLDKECSIYLSQLLSADSADIQIPKAYRKLLISKLVDYFRYHIDDFGELKSLQVLYSLYA